ncbi:hypothetical protein NHH03_06930 [Stieleria sp. TO1_6]|uniref:hypothetical protein n=1 Tax=Stieleria tagensis TaxID=2956795 RepID=UPI00209B3D5D|nr:hypothetical protein [Stieleria tagensis]MCO8121465.1 hypothetical protein [Stieleria tagensis]
MNIDAAGISRSMEAAQNFRGMPERNLVRPDGSKKVFETIASNTGQLVKYAKKERTQGYAK